MMLCADIEGDSLSPTKIWCLSLSEIDDMGNDLRSWTEVGYDFMRGFISNPDNTLIMHNGCSYDKPAMAKILGVPFLASIIDTLAISWYLEPKRVTHGLASHGEELGVPKVVVDESEWIGVLSDTKGQDIEEDGVLKDYDTRVQEHLERMVHRCEEDVKIQRLLWKKQWKHLSLLYASAEEAMHCVRYLTFKMECAALQEDVKWRLNKPDCEALHGELLTEQIASKQQLFDIMPRVDTFGTKFRPKKYFKLDGSISALGLKWQVFCDKSGIAYTHADPVKFVNGSKDPNPGSHQQVKAYLYSLGWEPTIFDYKRDKETGGVRKIPQIKNKETGELCPNIQSMLVTYPNLICLETLSVVTHRLVIINAFLANVDDEGFLQALIQGLTNTLRFKHKVLLNIPSLRKPYGARIRGLLIARSVKYELCGSDMCSLEDRVKQHFMMPYDPEYVEEMSAEGYDPHMAISLEAGMVSADEVAFYKWYKASH
jgi:hypothetical protein